MASLDQIAAVDVLEELYSATGGYDTLVFIAAFSISEVKQRI